MGEKNAVMEEMPAVETRPEGCGTASIHVTAESLSGAAGSGDTVPVSGDNIEDKTYILSSVHHQNSSRREAPAATPLRGLNTSSQ